MKQYIFEIPFSGTMSAWTDAESEEEARTAILRGDWDDSEETSFESLPEKGMTLMQIDDLTEQGKYRRITRG